MFRHVVKFLLLTVLVSSCSYQAAPVKESTGIALTNCVLHMPEIDLQVDAKCGSLAVPEDRSNPQSRQIDLYLAVVEAVKRRAESDPLFVLVGGPGQSAVESLPALFSMLYQIHQDRDIVLVDQRGTGKSNPLRCLDSKDESLEDDQAVAKLKECPENLDADLQFYTTDIAMQDLDQVRSELGYDTINLYGISYATRAALVYLKMYPEHVRSLILDAVVDPSFILYQDVARDGQASLELVFKRCEADEACSTTYPKLRSEFGEILQKLAETPAEITISHPITGKPLHLTLTDSTITNHIFSMLYSPDLVAMLPFVVHHAYETGDYAPLIAQGYLVDTGVYDGMFYAVTCVEDSSLVMSDRSADGLFGGNVRDFLDICKAWPHQGTPRIIHERVTSDIPLLMLSGEADPITPPWHAEALRDSFTNSLHVIFPGMGHGNGPSECGRRIMESFLETASTGDLDVSCIQHVEPPPFFADFSGPKP